MARSGSPPLDGIRVLDLSRIIAGPLCAQQLSDLGAEIVKLEAPGIGDDSRQNKPPEAGGEGHFFLAFNRGKKSIVLDLRTDEGKEVFHALAAKSDVLVENFRPGVMKRFGLDYESLKERHPHLVYLSVSAYGQSGPGADRPGFDPVLQAESGMMSITGEADGPPLRHPLSLVDTMTSIHATAAILAALYARRDTGRGQHIDLALFDVAIAALGNAGLYYLCSGELPKRSGNAHITGVPVNVFQTKTGPFYMAVGNNRLFGRLCREVLNRPELAEDERFATPGARNRNRQALYAILDEIFLSDTRESWMVRMRALPAGAVRTIEEALASEEVAHRRMVREVPHPTAGSLRLFGSVYNLSDTPVKEPVAPPLLGEHTAEILRDIAGLDDARIAELAAKGVVAGPAA